MLTLPLPLDLAPHIAACCGAAGHGLHGPERYRLARFHCLNVYQGQGVLILRGQRFPFRPGSVSLTPPDTDYAFEFATATTITWVHFRPGGGAAQAVPVMQHLGAGAGRVIADLSEVYATHAAQPARTAARVWDLLWRLVGSSAPAEQPSHPGMRLAAAFVEQHLDHPLSPEGIARAIGLSPTHLNRLVRASTGRPVMEWVRQRRIARAEHLLRHTSLPVRRVGELVGFPDPHRFNKAVRRELGMAPRRVRGLA